MLICPVCAEALIKYEKHYACANLHSFDIARQGYVNLLLSNQKKTLEPGDNKEMVQSRLLFLQKNYYLPISNNLNSIIEKALGSTASKNIEIADLGCGVGYYLNLLQSHLSKTLSKNIQYWGIDISKEAVHTASRQSSKITWLVCSAKKLPFADRSLDIVLCVFSPSYFEEIKRVLKPQGRVYIVGPGEDHLLELKNMLYDEVISKESDKLIEKTKGFLELAQCVPLRFTLHLSSQEDIANLIKMTPFYWRISVQKQDQFAKLHELTVTIDIRIWSFFS